MAATQEQDSSAYMAPSAEVVGNAFARQYYTILHQSPALVHRFYHDISKLGRNSDEGVMASTTTMDAINAKIQSYGSLKADIKYVDAQDSYNGGVIVLVTGSMVKDDDSRRSFTQTFFLAPQDKGYFVLNDIFRYVDCEKQNGDFVSSTDASQEETPPVQENHVQENHVQENHVEENHITEESNGELYHPHGNGEVQVKEEDVVKEEEPVAEVVDEAPDVSEIVVESNAKVVDDAPTDSQTPKKSYASIVMKDTPVAASSPILKTMPKMQEQQMHATPTPVPMAPPSSADVIDDNSSHDPEGECHSIYLRNLPHTVSYPAIEEALKRFGIVKSGSIQIRYAKGFVFGFADFEEAGAAISAIEASPITIAGRDVVIEEKRSTNRGTGRRFSVVRGGGGGGFRGEGGRGRGSYGGGRGYVRVENRSDYGNRDDNRSDFGNRGGRGHHKHRGEGFQRSDQTGIGVGRGNRGGGSGIGSMPRAHRVPAHA